MSQIVLNIMKLQNCIKGLYFDCDLYFLWLPNNLNAPVWQLSTWLYYLTAQIRLIQLRHGETLLTGAWCEVRAGCATTAPAKAEGKRVMRSRVRFQRNPTCERHRYFSGSSTVTRRVWKLQQRAPKLQTDFLLKFTFLLKGQGEKSFNQARVENNII